MMISFILWLLIGVATGYFAGQRGRDPVIWFMIGILLGALGLLLLFLLPSYGKDARSPPQSGDSAWDDFVLPELPPAAKPHDKYLISEWFYLDLGHQQQGPMGFHALKQAWDAGKVTQSSYVWTEGMPEWQKIEQLEELKEALKDTGTRDRD